MSEIGLENCPNPNHWKRGEGDVVLGHEVIGIIYSVVVCNDDGTPRYDDFLHLDNPNGAITVPLNLDGEIGLIVVERPGFKPGTTQTFPELDFSTLGAPSLEIPRGSPRKGETSRQAAVRETDEELNSPVRSVEMIGEITPNTRFNPHRLAVWRALVDHRFAGEMPEDVNERILKVGWHSPDVVREKVRKREIRCAMTLSALALHWANS